MNLPIEDVSDRMKALETLTDSSSDRITRLESEPTDYKTKCLIVDPKCPTRLLSSKMGTTRQEIPEHVAHSMIKLLRERFPNEDIMKSNRKTRATLVN